jgi:repressor LexA
MPALHRMAPAPYRSNPASRSWIEHGIITAGEPGDAFEGSRRRIERIEDLLPGIRPGDFFLRVVGDSMIDAGLQPGQYVVIRPVLPDRNGEICAVWVDGSGATLKRVYFDAELVRLVPANPNYDVQIYPADEVRIQGVLVASLAIQSFR